MAESLPLEAAMDSRRLADFLVRAAYFHGVAWQREMDARGSAFAALGVCHKALARLEQQAQGEAISGAEAHVHKRSFTPHDGSGADWKRMAVGDQRVADAFSQAFAGGVEVASSPHAALPMTSWATPQSQPQNGLRYGPSQLRQDLHHGQPQAPREQLSYFDPLPPQLPHQHQHQIQQQQRQLQSAHDFQPAVQPQPHHLSNSGSKQAATRNLHVTGFGPGVSSDDVHRLFAPYCEVQEVVMKSDYCFVNTASVSGAFNALRALQGWPLGGSAVIINYAKDRRPNDPNPPTAPTPSNPAALAAAATWQPADQHTSPPVPAPMVVSAHNGLPSVAQRKNNNPQVPTRNLHVTMYGPGTDSAQITALFQQFATIKEVVMKSGYCFVNTVDVSHATRARDALNGYRLNGGAIVINFAKVTPFQVLPLQLPGRRSFDNPIAQERRHNQGAVETATRAVAVTATATVPTAAVSQRPIPPAVSGPPNVEAGMTAAPTPAPAPAPTPAQAQTSTLAPSSVHLPTPTRALSHAPSSMHGEPPADSTRPLVFPSVTACSHVAAHPGVPVPAGPLANQPAVDPFQITDDDIRDFDSAGHTTNDATQPLGSAGLHRKP